MIILLLLGLIGSSHAVVFVLNGKFYAVPNSIPVQPDRIEIKAVNPSPGGLYVGKTIQFRATALLSDNSQFDVTKFVTWGSSNKPFATISNQSPTEGLATAIAEGITHISAFEPSSGIISNQFALNIQEQQLDIDRIEIEADSPPLEGLSVGQSLQYNAIAVLNDNSRMQITDRVTWVSSNRSVAVISNDNVTPGLLEAKSVGRTFISAFESSNEITSDELILDIQGVPVTECGTVAEIRANYSCVGRIVVLKGYLTSKLDSDNYMFYDGTGTEKIEYESFIPLFTPLEITGKVDGSEIEVSSYRLL